MSRKTLFFIFCGFIVCNVGACAKQIPSQNKKSEINDKIVVIIGKNISSCQYNGLVTNLQKMEKFWGTKNQFKIQRKDLANKLKLKNYKWRTILVYQHLNPKTLDGESKIAAATNQTKEDPSGKEVFKARIALKKGKCLFDEIYLHELGHAFGLLHVKNKQNIMNERVYQYSTFNDRQITEMKRLALGYVVHD